MSDDLVCALSGRTPAPEEYPPDLDAFADQQSMDPLPVGWIRVTVDRLGINPEWAHFQDRKRSAMAFIVANAQAAVADDNASPEIVAATRDAMVFMAEAPLRIAEAQIPKYVVISEDVVLSAPESDAEMLEIWSTITAALDIHTPGLRIADPGDAGDAEAEEDEDSEDSEDSEDDDSE